MGNDLSRLHDVYFDISGDSLNSKELMELVQLLPEDVRQIAENHGYGDTVFADQAQQYLSSKYDEFQSDKGN